MIISSNTNTNNEYNLIKWSTLLTQMCALSGKFEYLINLIVLRRSNSYYYELLFKMALSS